ncbi:hypothetical protein DPMN_001566 [Dreissena polymorpha]|uniref:Endonuclease/exonuclease/phosphatase domain-containing protein n=1 Tax=Dreissena polymorpha TaxID=45954 RepID=A0A9D4MKA0_DREPO|nr:hypothetical protein DPMN_001566 [Dreissena polymorpha]
MVTKYLRVCSAYRPDSDFKCIDELDRIISLTDKLNSTTLIGDDFNLGDINWKNKFVDSNASHPEECNKVVTFADAHSLNQIVDEPTDYLIPLSNIKKIRSLIQKKSRNFYWDYMNNIICDETEHKHGTT